MAISFQKTNHHQKDLLKSLLLALITIGIVGVIVYFYQTGTFDTRSKAAELRRSCGGIPNGLACCLQKRQGTCVLAGICQNGSCGKYGQKDNPPLSTPTPIPSSGVVGEWQFAPSCTTESAIWTVVLPDNSTKPLFCKIGVPSGYSLLRILFTNEPFSKDPYIVPRPTDLSLVGTLNQELVSGSYRVDINLMERIAKNDPDRKDPSHETNENELIITYADGSSIVIPKTVELAYSGEMLYVTASYPFTVSDNQPSKKIASLRFHVKNVASKPLYEVAVDFIRLVRQ